MSRASILAVGTELTQGQITNRNAAWISERLTDLGVDVVAHLTVPDDRARIRAALDAGAAEAELLVVTGGLGPTSDDFTREVIADWRDEPLEFHPAAWEKIVRRLTERGIEVAASNRSQCFFPRGAIVLENLEGTADGFRLSRSFGGRTTEILVLPGPPREGQHLWDRFVADWVARTFPAEAPTELESWHCVGKSESSLGEIVEAAVADFGIATGYRASMPYVEVKLRIPATLPRERRLALLAKMNAALAPYSVARNGEDLARALLEALRGLDGNFTLIDLGSAGRLAERLVGALRRDETRDLRARAEILTRLPADAEAGSEAADASGLPERASEWILILDPSGNAAVTGPRGKRARRLPNPYPNPALADRLGGYRAEMALKLWREMIVELAPADGGAE